MIDFTISDNFYENYIDKNQITVEIQLEAWNNILGLNVGLEEYFCNPFRNDNHAGCRLFHIGNAILLSDYGDSFWNRASIITAVRYKYSVDYAKALQIIFYDLASSNSRANAIKYSSTYSKVSEFEFKIYTENRGWRKWDRQFYGYANITREQLEFEQCFPISKYWTNSRKKPKEYIGNLCNKRDPGYVYKIGQNSKLRFPKRTDKNSKWISNIQKNQIGGNIPIKHQVGELKHIIIKKSLRDYLTVINSGYNSRFLPNEAVYLSKAFIQWLYDEFDLIIFIMDNDVAGMKAINRINNQWNSQIKDKPIFATSLPIEYIKDKITDPFDLAKHKSYGMTKVEFELSLIYEQAEENLYNFENDGN